MTFPQHTHWRIFSFPPTSITHCSCNLVYGSLKRAQLPSYCSLEFSFLLPPLCRRLPLALICWSLKLCICPLILECFTKIALLGQVYVVLEERLKESFCCSELKHMLSGMHHGGVSRNVFCPTVCARETKSRIHNRALLGFQYVTWLKWFLCSLNVTMLTKWTWMGRGQYHEGTL